MEGIISGGEHVLEIVVELAIMMFEFIGVAVVIRTGIRGLINYIKKNPDTKLIIAEGLTMGLEFKLGGEILRTVIVRTLGEIAVVAGIIVLRVALTMLLHWEIKTEKKEKAEAAAECEEAQSA